jgi:hypothetical protein
VEEEAAAHSGEARSSVSYAGRVAHVLLMLSPACGDVVARLEAERGIISRDEQHSSVAHTSEWACDRMWF